MIFLRPVILPLAVAICFAAEPIQKLPAMRVSESASTGDKYPLPQTTESITALQFAETVNALDAEDALKYLPGVFLRKRNNGDTQAVMATRVWGVSSSARSLIYADGVLLSALIANNNSIGGPRWGHVAPAEIERVEIMYGPFAAAYPGNSMGAVVEITTRQPEKFEASLTQTFAWQSFKQYGTRDHYHTTQTALTAGNRMGKLSLWVSGNFQDSRSQPLNYVTTPTFPTGTTGAFAEKNKFGLPANVVGTSGLLHTRITNAKLKAAYDFAPTLRATYTFGVWQNNTDATAGTYLRNATGTPTFAGIAGFASGTFEQHQRHSTHNITVRSDLHGAFDFEATASRYRMDRDEQRLPTTASASDTSFGSTGRVVVLGGTGWSAFDVKGYWRPGLVGRSGEKNARHVATFGAHQDRYELYNPTFNAADWRTGRPQTGVATEGDGTTRTQALWAQDVWRVTSAVKVTLGARYEWWRAFDGLNVNGSTSVRQPEVSARGFSPKASVAWAMSPHWSLGASIAKAYRFATASELYQLVSTGATFTSPNPNLKPDDVLAAEIKLERTFERGRIRLSVFQDEIHDAIIAQFNPLVPGSTQLFSFASNVEHVRAKGAEVVFEHNQVFTRSLSLNGSATWLDARTLKTNGQGQFGSAIGKRLPNIPDWRATVVATWRPDQRWAVTLGGRYSGMLTTTLDAADTNPNTWQGFAAWFVADARMLCRVDRHWTASLGVDNLLNRRYFLFHPFPQRTVVAELKYGF